jgi:hypothetical protein
MCAAEFLCALDVFARHTSSRITHCFNKASGIDRKDLIQYKEKNANNRVPFVITYHPALSNLSSIVREHWTTIQKPFLVVCSLEQMRLIRRAWLFGILLVQCLG